MSLVIVQGYLGCNTETFAKVQQVSNEVEVHKKA